MKSTTKRFAILLVGALAACGHAPDATAPARAPLNGTVAPTDARLAPLRDEFAAMVENGEVVSLSVGVAKDGEVIWAESFGLADREAGRPATPDTPYLLGSLSKSVSATALMTLVDDGAVALDDSVNEVIAPLSLTGYGGLDSDRVTVRDILHASGGVPHGSFSTADPAAIPGRTEMLPWTGMVVFPPGEEWEYSNFSLGLTEVVAEAVSGRRYEDFIADALFAPLGMNDASARYVDAMSETSAVRYSSSLERLESRSGGMPFGGLGMFASVNDLLSFGLFNLDPGEGGPVSRQNVELMHAYGGLVEFFGLGWYTVNDTLVSNGSVGGGNSNLSVVAAEGLVIVALTNKTSWDAVTDSVAEKIKSTFVEVSPDDGRRAYEAYAAVYENPYEPSPALIGRWNGRLQAPSLPDLPATLTFAADGGVTLSVAGGPPLSLDDLVLNTKSRFTGDTAGDFPPLFPEDGDAASEARIRPNLLKRGDRLAGYLQVDRGGDDYFYSVGVFAEFEKVK